MIARIEQIIEEQNLRERTRHRYLVHRRWYLYILLRRHGITLTRIGKICNRSHATVIHGIQQANYFLDTNDKLFLLDTLELQKEFAGVDIVFEQRNLINDVQDCRSMYHLSLVQARIFNNQYRNYNHD